MSTSNTKVSKPMQEIYNLGQSIDHRLALRNKRLRYTLTGDVSRMHITHVRGEILKGRHISVSIRQKHAEATNLTLSGDDLNAMQKQIFGLLSREKEQMELIVKARPEFDKLGCSGEVKEFFQKYQWTIAYIGLAKILALKIRPESIPEIEDVQRKAAKYLQGILDAYTDADLTGDGSGDAGTGSGSGSGNLAGEVADDGYKAEEDECAIINSEKEGATDRDEGLSGSN